MSSRSQRFGPRIGGWRSRPPVDAYRPSVTPVLTDTDRQASVWDVTYTHPQSGSSLSFPVLASNAGQAIQCGALRMHDLAQSTRYLDCKVTARTETTEDTRRMAVRIESVEEWRVRNGADEDRKGEQVNA